MKLPNHITQAPEIFRRYLFFQKSQHWNRQQVLDYQNAKLKEIVSYAGKYVPYYRNLFREIGLDTATFRGIEDLPRIPLLDKDTLRTRQKEFVADTAHLLGAHQEKTSGSTGTPLTLMIDKHSRANKYAAVARAFRWAGYRPGALRFVIKGLSEYKAKPYGYDLLRNMIFLNSSIMTRENCLAAARLATKFKPSVFEGYARSFIDFFNHTSNDYTIASPRGIFVYGESVTPRIREFVQSSYGAHLFDFYSHAENVAMICEKPDQKKYMMEDYFFPEIVDQEGNPAADCHGELVGTSFYNYAIPLIRYKTRDYLKCKYSEINDNQFLEVVEIEGRVDDFITTPDGKRIFLNEGAITYGEGIIASQLVQEKPDTVSINLIVDSNFNMEYCDKITKGLHKRGGDNLKYKYHIVDELERRKSGKIPFIISKIGYTHDNLDDL